jgi:hypothetical protein
MSMNSQKVRWKCAVCDSGYLGGAGEGGSSGPAVWRAAGSGVPGRSASSQFAELPRSRASQRPPMLVDLMPLLGPGRVCGTRCHTRQFAAPLSTSGVARAGRRRGGLIDSPARILFRAWARASACHSCAARAAIGPIQCRPLSPPPIGACPLALARVYCRPQHGCVAVLILGQAMARCPLWLVGEMNLAGLVRGSKPGGD